MNRIHRAAVLHIFGAVAIVTAASSAADIEKVTEHCWVQPGSINGAVIRANDQQMAVYGWDQGPVDRLLLTHGRRDVVWRAGAWLTTSQVVAPTREKYMLEKGPEYWTGFPKLRSHDYAQQTTKVPQIVIPVAHWVSDGDRLTWNGLNIEVLETPGYTPGSVTYVVEVDGKRVGFCGDLLYGDGQLLDLFSFQDAIAAAQVRGYHGYGARLAELVTSLDTIIESKVDIVVPARGPIIHQPTESARRLKERVQNLYRNYLSTSALHWYFKEERMRHCGERVLGKGADIELMPYVTHDKTPEWIYENSTSRLLLAESGRGFLVDCGYQRVIDAVQQLIDRDVIERVD
jgi:glyoxylase-like metal-dependent hydrolase (beta-lactamase superfamily II)